MKDATTVENNPRTEREYEAEIDRLFGEIEMMMRNTKRHQESMARKQAATWDSIRWLEKKIHVGKSA